MAETAVTVFKPDELALITATVAKDATKEELAMFLYVAAKRGLNPLARQIHFVKRGNSGTIQTGIDGFRLIAQRTGQYAPSGKPTQFEVSKTGNLISATVYGNKIMNGTAFEFSATAYYDEYVPKMPNGQVFPMWQKMPRTMLEKCAESKLLRKGFPEELSGLYSDEEMHQADNQPLNHVQAGASGASTTVTDVIEGQAEAEVICPKHGVAMRKNKWGGYSHATDEKGKEGKVIWCNLKANELVQPPIEKKPPIETVEPEQETPELAPNAEIGTVTDDGAAFDEALESLSRQIWGADWQPKLRNFAKENYGYTSRKQIKESQRAEIIAKLTAMAEIK